jgi:hypothetical protein
MKDAFSRAEDLDVLTSEPFPDKSFVIVIVGGSILKRRLFEHNIERLRLTNVSIVHLVPPTLTRRSADSFSSFSNIGDEILELSTRFRIIALIPLVDSVVGYCDAISAKLGLRGNNPDTSLLRVDKEKMQQACVSAGLDHAKSMRVSSVNEAIYVWKDHFGSGEVVLKPPRSGGCDGIAICSTIVEISHHVEQQLNAINLEKLRNTEIVIQELIRMTYEYVINTVTVDGIHFVCDVWRSAPKRNGNLFLYDTQELIIDLESVKEVIEYTKCVLTAVGVRHGACHTEVGVVMNKNNNTSIQSIYLIEVNCRLAGEIRTSYTLPGWNGEDQIFWLLISLIDPKKILTSGIPPSKPSPENTVSVIFLRNLKYQSCCISETGLETIKKLPSFFRFGRSLVWANETSKPKNVIRLGRTVDLISSPGVVMLVGPSARQDAYTVREIENSILYDPKMHAL